MTEEDEVKLVCGIPSIILKFRLLHLYLPVEPLEHDLGSNIPHRQDASIEAIHLRVAVRPEVQPSAISAPCIEHEVLGMASKAIQRSSDQVGLAGVAELGSGDLISIHENSMMAASLFRVRTLDPFRCRRLPPLGVFGIGFGPPWREKLGAR